MSIIKKFFMKKKEEALFKLNLGGSQGHSLLAQPAEASSSSQKPDTEVYTAPKREGLSDEVRAAVAAAVARKEKKDLKEFNTSLAYVKAQVKRELEAEKNKDVVSCSSAVTNNDSASNLACQGVFFRCPLISEEILPKNEWKSKIREFLYEQLEQEKALSACLIIQNCNNKEKAEECIKTLTKYLENLINFPEEEKYCKIRMSNRVFCERVRYIEGALDFLLAAGFRQVDIDNEPFLIWTKENIQKDYDLIMLSEALLNSEPINLVLDRNIKVLLPSQAKCFALPDDFYRISPEEIKREQLIRSTAAENAQILRTKAMRERDEQRVIRMYKYSLVRVKFPNGLLIQGTFGVYEKLRQIFIFVQSCIKDEELEFRLATTGQGNFSQEDMDKTLCDLRLIPNIVLLFNANTDGVSDRNFIKEDLLLLVQST